MLYFRYRRRKPRRGVEKSVEFTFDNNGDLESECN